MKIIGLTGPSGSGKGVCCEYFRTLGIPCIDTDAVYHDLLLPPSPCANELAERFGHDILRGDGTLDRQRLAAIVFLDPSGTSAKDLNAISHKYVKEKTLALLDELRAEGKLAAVVDAPLLFEAEFDKFCDFTIAILADRDIRLNRIVARDSLSREKANARISAQKNDEFYCERANYTFFNNSERNDIFPILLNILKKESVSFGTQLKSEGDLI